MKPKENNLAFVDGQNLHFGTSKCSSCAEKLKKELKLMKCEDCVCGNAWKVDLAKFRVFLAENYNVNEAYYFIGHLQEKHDEMYQNIQKAGFIIVFREHHQSAKSIKKGNVDTDIVFEVMKKIIDNQEFDKVVLISSDGDYKKLVKFLISKNKFRKILFPNKKFASSLYNELGSEFFDYLENNRNLIAK
jgi:uncharacterized LabA/DUF88 family protein